MSMRITPLNNISFKNNNIQSKESKGNQEEKSKGLSNSAKLGIGLLGSAALGFATYYIFKGKKLSESVKSSNTSEIENSINNTLAELKSNVEDLTSKSVKKLTNGGYRVQYSTQSLENQSSLRDILLFDNSGNLEKRIISKFDPKSDITTHQLFMGDADMIIKKPEEIDSECFVKEVIIKKSEPSLRNIMINRSNNQVQYQDYLLDGKLNTRFVYKVKTDAPGSMEFNNSDYTYENGKLKNKDETSLKFKTDVGNLLLNNVSKSNGVLKVQFISTVDSTDALLDTLIFDPSGKLQKRVVSKFDPQENSITHKLYKGDVEQIVEKPNSIDNKYLIKEVTVENFEPFVQDTLARNIIVKRNNVQNEYQDYFRKGKLYERSVYNEDLNNRDAIEVTRYNYAYENGNYVATAKQTVCKDGQQHGVYKDGKFESYPVSIKKVEDKEFSVADSAYSVESLYEVDKRFNPDNL